MIRTLAGGSRELFVAGAQRVGQSLDLEPGSGLVARANRYLDDADPVTCRIYWEIPILR